jgi:hypothetical protein
MNFSFPLAGGASVGGSHDTSQEATAKANSVLVDGIRHKDKVRWNLEENKNMEGFQDGVRRQTFQLYIDVPLPVKAYLRLVCRYRTKLIDKTLSNPKKQGFLELVLNLQ